MSAVVLAALALTFLMSKPISAYQLGEVYAQNMYSWAAAPFILESGATSPFSVIRIDSSSRRTSPAAAA